MPANFHRQTSFTPENIYINRWWSGLVTNRSALFTPVTALGLQIIARMDTLIDGLNIEISPQMTLIRRPGFAKFSTAQFGASDYPLAFASFKKLDGTIHLLVDTPTEVASFTSSAITQLYSKGTTSQSSFLAVGNYVYVCDGTNLKKWDGTNLTNWGIAAPATAPTQSTVGGGSLSPTGGYGFVYCFVNSNTNHVSTASPASGNLGAQTNVNYSLSGDLSSDPQVNQIWIFRTDDGGGVYYFDASLTNIPAAGGSFSLTAAGTASGGSTVYTGTITGGAGNALAGASFAVSGFTNGANNGTFSCTASTATTLTLSNASGVAETHSATARGVWVYTDSNSDASLNTDEVAPIAGNDPPPAGSSLAVFHMGRVWVASGNSVYFSNSETTLGNPEEAFYTPNVFTFPGKVTAMASTPQGLLAFTADDVYVILGTDTADFYSQKWQSNFGVQSQNCLVQDSDAIYVYTSRRQLFELSNSGIRDIGNPIQDQLDSTFDPASSYLALHRSGQDIGIFLSDGSANLKKYDPRFNAWGCTAQPVGGIRAIASIETTVANWQLLMGRTAGSGYILNRTLTDHSDDGSSYAANAIIGSITLSAPGQPLAEVSSVLLEVVPVGTYPTVSILLNEISGTAFVTLPNPVDDPVQFAGTAYASTTVWSRRHYLKTATKPLPSQVKHLQIKVAFATENAASELLGLALA